MTLLKIFSLVLISFASVTIFSKPSVSDSPSQNPLLNLQLLSYLKSFGFRMVAVASIFSGK